jgi:hypothetical protein
VAKSWVLHSIGRCRSLASNPEWAFRPDVAESALTERHSRCLDHHLDHRLGRLQLGLSHPSHQVMQVRWQWRHWPQALRLHVDLERHRLQAPPVRRVLQPGRSQ